MSTGSLAAVDLGASSGRVIVGHAEAGRLELAEAHRFANGWVDLPDGLHWDVTGLLAGILAGLRAAASMDPEIAGVAVDSWGVDYGLLDSGGGLVGLPFHYRDRRTEAAVDRVNRSVSAEHLYERTGTQVLPINTIYQLAAEAPGRLQHAESLLMIPDLVAFWLAGVQSSEETNASTSGVFDPARREWAFDLVDELDLPRRLFRTPSPPGTPVGPLRPVVAADTGLPPSTSVTLVGSHDTASAVVGVPAVNDRFAYIACGTWALVGVELERPIRTPDSRSANFTNELGVDGRIRFLRNVMGLWVLQESLRTWAQRGEPADLEVLLARAEILPDDGPRVDIDDPTFLPPGDMPARIAAACRGAGLAPPSDAAATVRCIVDSLADAFARAVETAERLSGRQIEVVHLVGGGSRNKLLCRLTATATGRPVIAGPVEATAIGNLLVQARSHGLLSGDLDTLRAVGRAASDLVRYEPGGTAPVGT